MHASGARFWIVIVALVGWALAPIALAAPASAARPSIVFILSDDEDLASHRVMAKTKALIEDQGTVLANYFVSYSFCCPSRATTLRGQYPHNHRVEGNEWPAGGYEKFRALGLEGSTIATWLPLYVQSGWLVPEDVAMLASMPRRRQAMAWAERTYGGASSRALHDFQLAGTELAFLRERAERGHPLDDFVVRERQLLAELSRSRAAVSSPART